MQKKVLTEQSLYYGDVSMPEGFEINHVKLTNDIVHSNYFNIDFPFSKEWDLLHKYLTEHINVKFKINLITKKTWGDVYNPLQSSKPLINIDPVDLQNSPDFTLLYGVRTEDCMVKIFYDDNRRKGRSWDIELQTNMFIMFPSTNMYYIKNNQKDSLNLIQTTTYEYI
jgi:hypothetical protein